MTKLIWIIGDPDNQRPDNWRYTGSCLALDSGAAMLRILTNLMSYFAEVGRELS
jgi:hypothetical protein